MLMIFSTACKIVKLLHHPKQKPGGGPQTDNHLPPILLQVNFLEKTTFGVWCPVLLQLAGPLLLAQQLPQLM